MIARQMEIKKVGDGAEADPVDDVSQGAADDSADIDKKFSFVWKRVAQRLGI